MTFSRVFVLYFIWAAPALFLVFALGMARRRGILARYCSKKGLETIASLAGAKRRWVRGVFFCLSAACCVIALAGPRYGYVWREVQRKGVDLVLALDCSKSMLATDILPSRLDRAKREIKDLLARMHKDRAALVIFAGTAFLQVPLTLDHSGFNLFLQSALPENLPMGGTNLTAAVDTSLKALKEKDGADKAIILITDGEATGKNPLEAAKRAEDQGVRIFCIGVGGRTGAPIPEAGGGFKKSAAGDIVMAKLDEAALKKMAEITGGAYVRSVAGDMDLDIIYENQIQNKMTKATMEGGKRRVYQDRFQWFLLPGFLLLATAMAINPRKKAAAVLAVLIALAAFAGPGKAFAGPVQKGIDAFEQKDYKSARSFFEQAEKKHGDAPEILFNLGNAMYRQGKFEDAKIQFEKVLAGDSDPLKQKAHYNLGNTLFRLNQPQKAIEHYQEALDLDPADQQAGENLAYVKKWMEKQKSKQQQGDNSDKNQDQNKEQQNQQKKQDQSDKTDSQKGEDRQKQNSADKNQDKPEDKNDNRQNRAAGDPNKDKQTGGQNQNQNSGQQPPAGAAGAEKQAGEKQPVSPDVARGILNRLKDQPGKALMPQYGGQTVEKDW